MNETVKVQRIYFDPIDDANDGKGWNVVDDAEVGGIASRFASASGAVAHSMEIGAKFYLDSEPDPNDLIYVNGRWIAPLPDDGMVAE